MKRLIITTLAFCFCFAAIAQKPLIDKRQMPNAVHFLPPPPDTNSAAFQYDKAQYQWGMEQRKDSTRCAIAVSDAVWSVENICRIFSKPFGMKITPKATPAIYHMLEAGIITADQAGKLPKNHYMRTRPYVYYGDHTIVPEDEEELSHNGSYPSGHTIIGWSAALLLSELNPDSADAILARGYMYGQSRVIAGYHWQSDVDAGRLVSSAAIARLHADPNFRELMKAARKEYDNLTANKGPLNPTRQLTPAKNHQTTPDKKNKLEKAVINPHPAKTRKPLKL
ncbi:MAG: acid phosphatase [bacterium]